MERTISTPQELSDDERAFLDCRLAWNEKIILELFYQEFEARLRWSVLARIKGLIIPLNKKVNDNNSKPKRIRPKKFCKPKKYLVPAIRPPVASLCRF